MHSPTLNGHPHCLLYLNLQTFFSWTPCNLSPYTVFPSLKMDAFADMRTIMLVKWDLYLSPSLWTCCGRYTYRSKSCLSHAKEVVYRIAFFALFVTYCTWAPAPESPVCFPRPVVNCNGIKGETCSTCLKADYDIKCQGPKYDKYVIVGYCFIVYVVTLPAVAFVMVWRINKRQTNQVNMHIREN